MSLTTTIYARCKRLGISLVKHGDGWYWGGSYGPYPTKKQAALCALQAQEK